MTIGERSDSRRRRIIITLLLVGIFVAVAAYIAWDRGFRERPQPDWVTSTADMRFKYGSIGA